MKQRFLFGMALLFFISAIIDVLAQLKSVSGTITDFRDNALPGVNVIVKGTRLGTVTDTNGRYAISVPDESITLVFSFVGFISREVEIGSQLEVNVVLGGDLKQLDEVVVTALNIERNTKTLHSSVTQINGDNLSW